MFSPSIDQYYFEQACRFIVSSGVCCLYFQHTYFSKHSFLLSTLQVRWTNTSDHWWQMTTTKYNKKNTTVTEQSPSCRPQLLINHCSDKIISYYEYHLRKVRFNVLSSSVTRLQVVLRLLCDQYHWLDIMFIVNLIYSRLVCTSTHNT